MSGIYDHTVNPNHPSGYAKGSSKGSFPDRLWAGASFALGVFYGCNGGMLDVAQPTNSIASKCFDVAKTGRRMMKRLLIILGLLSSTAYAADGPTFMNCRFDNGQLLETVSFDGVVRIRWDEKGDWKKAFARYEAPNLIVQQITNAGSFVLMWDVKAGHGAHGWTKNDSGRNSDGAAYCWFK